MKNENESKKQIQKRGVLVFIGIILIAVLCCIFLFLNGQKETGHIAVVYQNGKMVDKIDLNGVTTP